MKIKKKLLKYFNIIDVNILREALIRETYPSIGKAVYIHDSVCREISVRILECL